MKAIIIKDRFGKKVIHIKWKNGEYFIDVHKGIVPIEVVMVYDDNSRKRVMVKD